MCDIFYFLLLISIKARRDEDFLLQILWIIVCEYSIHIRIWATSFLFFFYFAKVIAVPETVRAEVVEVVAIQTVAERRRAQTEKPGKLTLRCVNIISTRVSFIFDLVLMLYNSFLSIRRNNDDDDGE